MMAWPKGQQKKVLVPGKLRGQQPPATSAVPLPSWAEGGVVVSSDEHSVHVRFPNGMSFIGAKEE